MEDKPIPAFRGGERTDQTTCASASQRPTGGRRGTRCSRFSRRYFTSEDRHLFSYSQAMENAARAVERTSPTTGAFRGRTAPGARGRRRRDPPRRTHLLLLKPHEVLPAQPPRPASRCVPRRGRRRRAVRVEQPGSVGTEVGSVRTASGTAPTGDHRLLAATGQLPPDNLGRIQFRETAKEVRSSRRRVGSVYGALRGSCGGHRGRWLPYFRHGWGGPGRERIPLVAHRRHTPKGQGGGLAAPAGR